VGECGYIVQRLLITTLDIGEWLASRLGRFIRGEAVPVVDKRQHDLQDVCIPWQKAHATAWKVTSAHYQRLY
jgi:hypothetical protein